MNRGLLFLVGALLFGMSLRAQTYQSKFEQVKFDLGKSQGTVHGDLTVEPSTGAVNMRIPLGPGIGARGAQFTPELLIRSSANTWSVVTDLDPNAELETPPFLLMGPESSLEVQAMMLRWQATNRNYYASGGRSSFFPGSIEWQVAEGLGTPVESTINLPGGRVIYSSGAVPSALTDPLAAAKDFGRGASSGWGIARLPYNSSLTPSPAPFVRIGSSDELVLGLVKSGVAPELSIPDPENNSQSWIIPSCILVIRGEVAYEFALSGVAKAGVSIPLPRTAQEPNGRSKQWWAYSRYLLSRIINRYGDSIEFDYGVDYLDIQTQGVTYNGVDFTARWLRKGQPTGVSVRVKYAGMASLPVPQPSVAGVSAQNAYNMQVEYLGDTPSPNYSFCFYSVDGATEFTPSEVPLPSFWLSTTNSKLMGYLSNACFPTKVVNLGNQESVNFNYSSARLNIDNSAAWPVLSNILYSNGKQTTLEWNQYPYFPSGSESAIRQDGLVWGVASIREYDQSTFIERLTSHNRVTPLYNYESQTWASTKFYDVITHQLNTTATHQYPSTKILYFVEPTGSGGLMQSVAHFTHQTRETREFSNGDWQSDIDLPTSQSNAAIIIVSDRWDARTIGNSSGSLTYHGFNPYPTRTRIWDGGVGILKISETKDWNNSAFSWAKNTEEIFKLSEKPDLATDYYSLALGAQRLTQYSGLQYSIEKNQTVSFDFNSWLGPLVTTEQKTRTDQTPNRFGPAVIAEPMVGESYLPGTSLIKTWTVGDPGNTQITTTYGYANASGSSYWPLLESILVSDPSGVAPLSGKIGMNYEYDEQYGYLKAIRPSGVLWNQKETRDAFGRVRTQTSPDGVQTIVNWDSAGRLSEITVGTESTRQLQYPTTQTVIFNQSPQSTENTFDSWGQLLIEKRKNSDSTYAYRLHSYDELGRETTRTVWQTQGSLADTGKPNLVSTAVTITSPCGHYGHSGTPVISEDPYPTTGGSTCPICGSSASYTTLPAMYTGTRTEYDWLGRVAKTIDPNGVTITNTYGSWEQGLKVTQTVRNAKVLNLSTGGNDTQDLVSINFFDSVGRLVKRQDANQQYTSYFYDALGRISKVQQYAENLSIQQPARTWSYDHLGRLSALFQPESGVTKYEEFTVAGQATRTTYGAGQDGAKVITSVYDSISHLIDMVGQDVQLHFDYDNGPNDGTPSRSKLISATSGGINRQFEYLGSNGKMSSLRISIPGLEPLIQQTSYDPNFGLLDSRTYANGRTQSFAMDWVKGLPNGVSSTGMSPVTINYEPVHLGISAITVANGPTSIITYGSDQTRMNTLTHMAGNGAILASWRYDYDAAGRLLSDGIDCFQYDPLGRLGRAYIQDPQAASDPRGILQEFGYDPYGNRTSLKSWSVLNWVPGQQPTAQPITLALPGNRVLSYEMTSVEKAQMALTNRIPETIGNSQTGVGSYGYDPQGNLLSIQKSLGSSADAVNSTLDLTYDALGRVKSMWDKSRNVSEVYYYDDQGLRVITEIYDGMIAPQNLIKKRYQIYNEVRQLTSEWELVLDSYV